VQTKTRRALGSKWDIHVFPRFRSHRPELLGHLMRITQRNFTDADTRTRPTLRTDLADLPAVFSSFPPYAIRLRRLKMIYLLSVHSSKFPQISNVMEIISYFFISDFRFFPYKYYFCTAFAAFPTWIILNWKRSILFLSLSNVTSRKTARLIFDQPGTIVNLKKLSSYSVNKATHTTRRKGKSIPYVPIAVKYF